MKRLETEADLRAFRERLADTVAAHGPGYLRLSDLSGWTVADAEAAAALERMRKVEDETDPEGATEISAVWEQQHSVAM